MSTPGRDTRQPATLRRVLTTDIYTEFDTSRSTNKTTKVTTGCHKSKLCTCSIKSINPLTLDIHLVKAVFDEASLLWGRINSACNQSLIIRALFLEVSGGLCHCGVRFKGDFSVRLCLVFYTCWNNNMSGVI